jgi:hypothetical protein
MNTVRLRLAVATVVTAIVAATTAVLPSPASAAVPGLEIVTISSPTDSFDSKSVTAMCPFGTVTIGSGATIEGGLGQVTIDDITTAATSVTATGYEIGAGTGNQWSVQAQAVCANPPPGHQIVSATSPTNGDNKSVTALCPAGTVTIGSGAAISGGSGDVELDDLLPAGESVTAIGSEIFNGNSWNVKAYAICGNALPGLQIVSASSANTATNKNVTVACPAGTEVLTAAGEITGGAGRVLLDDLFADVAAITATGKETGAGTNIPWTVRAIAVCATP